MENQKKKQRQVRRSINARALNNTVGMTIVELMIVLTIIAAIMGMVAFSVMGALDTANIKEAEIEIGSLSGLVESYYLRSSPRSFPNALDDLASGPSPLTKKVPKDPWGNDYVYRKINKREFEIYSAGPDGVEGTEDDVRPNGDDS